MTCLKYAILRYNTIPILERPQPAAHSFHVRRIRLQYPDYRSGCGRQSPCKGYPLVNKWIDAHEAELLSLWEKAVKGERIGTVEPLK